MVKKICSIFIGSILERLRKWNKDRNSEGKATIGLHKITWKMKWLRYVVPERWIYEWMWRLVQLREERNFWHYLEDGNRRFGRPLSKEEIGKIKQFDQQYTSVRVQVMDNNTPIAGLCIDYMFFSDDSRNDDNHVCRVLVHYGEFDNYITPNQYLSDKFDEQFERIKRENVSFWYEYLMRNHKKVAVESTQTYRKRQYDESRRFIETGDTILRRAVFSFSREEERRGKESLEELGIMTPYVCIFARDGQYNAEMRKVKTFLEDSLDLRNSDINNFKKVTHYFWQRGIQSVRMGALMEKEYHCEGAVDYASVGRTDFLDAYIFSKCRFFIGDVSGIFAIPLLFNNPIVLINLPVAIYGSDRLGPITLGIFLKYYDSTRKRCLRLKEWCQIFINIMISDSSYTNYMRQHYAIIHNSPEEILDVAKEMEAIQNHAIHYTDRDEELQRKYREIIKSFQRMFPIVVSPFPGRIGTQWLRDNEWFLE